MRLPPVADLVPETSGWGYFLCTEKEVRAGRKQDFLVLTLVDRTGRIAARMFDQIERYRTEFDAGEFVRVEGRVDAFNGQPQLIVSAIRRVHAAQDASQGFREEDLVPSAARPVDEMWRELQGLVSEVGDSHVRVLLARVLADHEAGFKEWPAARQIHHAYRGGFLEHVLQMAVVGRLVARAYEADADLVVAGAILHDIGKLQELQYEIGGTTYTRDGNLVGHIGLGLILVRETINTIAGFPSDLRARVEHLVVSHHGSHEHGAPVEPKTVEAFILAMVDDLDARLNQVRLALAGVPAGEEFTEWHRRLGRVLHRGSSSR
jgi:3'-5' exoribonuclease